MKTTRTPKRSFRPSVEALEAREVPTVTANPLAGNPQTLVIRGDAGNNNVQILQNDDANTIRVIGDGQTSTFTSSQFTRIQVELRDGNDTVNYRLVGGSDFERAKVIDIDLGNGRNNATVDLLNDGQGGQATIEAAATINIRSLGWDGRVRGDQLGGSKVDTVVVNLGAIGDGAFANVRANLGIGNDVATVNQSGELSGSARLNIALEGVNARTRIDPIFPWSPTMFANLDGNDTFTVNLNGDVPDNGLVSVTMRGGFGNDTLFLNQNGELDGSMNVNIQGGNGDDTLTAWLDLEDDSRGSLVLTMLGNAGGPDLFEASYLGTNDLELFVRTIAS